MSQNKRQCEECGETRECVAVPLQWVGEDFWMCAECLEKLQRQEMADRDYQAGYNYACGYRD